MCDVGRYEFGRSNLVQEREERVIVVAVDQRDVDILVRQRPGGPEPTKARPDYEPPGSGLLGLRSGA